MYLAKESICPATVDNLAERNRNHHREGGGLRRRSRETVIKTASRTNKAPYAANKPLVTKTHKHHRVWKSTRKNSTVSASRRKFSSAGAEGTSMTLSCQEAYTMLPRGVEPLGIPGQRAARGWRQNLPSCHHRFSLHRVQHCQLHRNFDLAHRYCIFN